MEFKKNEGVILLKFFKKHEVKIHEHADGCRVNLDRLPEAIRVEYVKLIDAILTIREATAVVIN